MAMTEKEKKFFVEKIQDYYSQAGITPYGLNEVSMNIFDTVKNVFECEKVNSSNVEEIFKYILENRMENPEAFDYLFEYIPFNRSSTILTFFEKIEKECLIPNDFNKIITLLNVTNRQTIIDDKFNNSKYLLFKKLNTILPKEYFQKLNEVFADVLEKTQRSYANEEISYKFVLEDYLFLENAEIQYPLSFTQYYPYMNRLIEPAKRLLKIEVRNVHPYTIGTQTENVELIFVGEDLPKYKAFVKYLTRNLHNFIHQEKSEDKESDVEMFLLKFALEYETKDKNTMNTNLRTKI